MSAEFKLPELKEAVERLDDLFATAFSCRDEAMQDWVAVKFALKTSANIQQQVQPDGADKPLAG